MVTAEERERAFRKEFKELLGKHGAELEIQDVSKTTYIEEWRMVVTMSTRHDDVFGGCLEDYTEFYL